MRAKTIGISRQKIAPEKKSDDLQAVMAAVGKVLADVKAIEKTVAMPVSWHFEVHRHESGRIKSVDAYPRKAN